MSKALVIGLGMGQQYALWLRELGYDVYTVDLDPAKAANYTDVAGALKDHPQFDVTYIGTPNWTHEPIARQVAAHSKLVLVEKPGVKNSGDWRNLVTAYPNTRIMMVKNNQFRPEILQFKQLSDQSERIYVRWNNANRIPNPGSWFTTKDRAFGGVSRDLMPHMLSYYCALTNYKQGIKIKGSASQRYELKDITTTDYGIVNPNGTYDVDDFCHFEYQNGNTTWILSANWRTGLDHDDSSISFGMKSSAVRHELGLCPGEAYKAMIQSAMLNLNNNEFWQQQLEQDIWIHEQIENL
jgi:predicted dehydrogenase